MIRRSLHKRVLLWVVTINALVVGAETLVLARQVANQSRQEAVTLAEDLVYTLRGTLQTDTSRDRSFLAAEFEGALRDRLRGAAPGEARAAARALAVEAVAHLLPASPRPSAWATWVRTSYASAIALDFQHVLEARYAASGGVRTRFAAEALATTAVARLLPRGGLSVGPLLSWPSWNRFSDAILLDRNLELYDDGRIEPTGVALNPTGRSRRRGDLDQQAVYGAIARVIESGEPLSDVEGGKVVPIVGEGGLFGACWYVLPPPFSGARLFWRTVLPAFLFSTLLLSLGTFVALRRFVLDPVDRLASAARSVAAGDLSARVREPDGRDELTDLVRTFNVMTGRVERFNEELESEVERATDAARRAEAEAMTQRRLAAMGELAGGIAHEINNPLGGLMNAVEVLGREDLPEEKRRRYLELLTSGLERMRHTVGQLLRFTPRSADAEPFPVARPVLDAVALVRHRANQLGVEILVSDGTREATAGEPSAELEQSLAALPAVRGQAHELAQAVLNLLVNSLDAIEEHVEPGAGPPRGRIEVLLGAREDGVRLEVRDDGPGVPPEVLERAADLYFTTKAPGRGSGLGLAMVHKVVAAHGGRVEIESRPGAGFSVLIDLPALAQDESGT